MQKVILMKKHMDKDDLLIYIEKAFSNVHLENGISIKQARVIDDRGSKLEQRKARDGDELFNWRNVKDEELETYQSSLSFYDAKGIRFYLPCYMKYIIENLRSSLNSTMSLFIYSLTPSDNVHWFKNRFSLVSSVQVTAIVGLLRWLELVLSDPDEVHDVRSALKYWVTLE